MILPIKGLATVDAGRVRNAAILTGVDVPSPVRKGIVSEEATGNGHCAKYQLNH